MRPELSEPIASDLLKAAAPFAADAYARHEAGQDTAAPLLALAGVARKATDTIERIFTGAFGSVGPQSFAQRALVDWSAAPKDLTHAEMLELFEHIYRPRRGQEFLFEYWMHCLKVNTGNDRVSDLIFWPDLYFGSSYSGREPSPSEALEIALNDAKRGT
jgi:hypothetical protein